LRTLVGEFVDFGGGARAVLVVVVVVEFFFGRRLSAAAEEAFEKAGLLGEFSRALERERLKLFGFFVH
jgi:hypothetical protein